MSEDDFQDLKSTWMPDYAQDIKKLVPMKQAVELGAKFDDGKIRFSLLTRSLATPLKRVAEVLEYGARKYQPNSWQHVPNAKERYEDALDRHLNSWKSGEVVDPESGLPHLAHIATNALFLLWFYKGE